MTTHGGGHPSAAGENSSGGAHRHQAPPPKAGNPRLGPDWQGDGQAVTFAFGGDVHFPAGTNLGDRLAADPSDALGPTVPQLLSGVDLSMVNYESALTDGTCPDAQGKQFVFYAPPTVVDAFKGAGVTLITEANNHGEDCGPPGLQTALATRAQTGYTILGIGQNAAQAFTPYTTTIHGQHIAIIAATQVIDSDLQTAWTATATQPGLASAYDVNDLVAAVQAARKTADTVIVYLHWGTELDACPNPLQEPLAQRPRQGRGRHHRGHPRARAARGRLPRFGLRRLRLGQLRLLRQHAARERQRLARHCGDGSAHRSGHLAAGRHRRTTCRSRSPVRRPPPL